jgi:basic membrane protein A and related proteins
MLRRTFLATAATAGTILVAPAVLRAQTRLRVGLVLPGPVTDGTFNSAAAQGIRKAQQKYPIDVSIRENTDFAQIAEALLAYGREGYEIHKQFPRTWFVVNTAQVAAAPNLASFDNRWGDAGYLAGAVAASVSQKGVVGHVGGIPVPVIQDYNKGFERGAKRFNPNIRVLSAYVGSFSDVAKGKEITLSLIEQGADVVTSTGNENVVGTIQAAQERRVLAIGTAFDSAAMAPDTIVTTALINMDVNIDLAIGRIADRTIEPRAYVLGLNDGGIGLAPFRNFETRIPAERRAQIAQLVEDMRAGRITDLP